MKIYIYTLIAISTLFMFSCSDMNDVHSAYLKDGERIDIGKLDSLKVLPGDERVMLKFWASDPRAKSVLFNWVPEDDSIYFEIKRSSPTDTFEIIIGGANSTKTIAEGNYTLQARTSDNLGNYSLIFEKSLNVYGDKYRSSLMNRIVGSTQYNSKENELELEFSGPFTDDDIGIEVRLTNKDGEVQNLQFAASVLVSPITISGFDVSKGMSYRTMYIPDSLAIDRFYTLYSPIEIKESVNVALNKPATVSGVNAASTGADKTVDGLITSASRWVSPATGEHWLEIDLEKEYMIDGFKTWTGASGNMSHPTRDFMFQVDIDGEWINVVEVVNNVDPEYGASFPEVTTRKVRYYVPEYADNRVRLYEIEVYSTIRY